MAHSPFPTADLASLDIRYSQENRSGRPIHVY
jgi:hypothetical protein